MDGSRREGGRVGTATEVRRGGGGWGGWEKMGPVILLEGPVTFNIFVVI